MCHAPNAVWLLSWTSEIHGSVLTDPRPVLPDAQALKTALSNTFSFSVVSGRRLTPSPKTPSWPKAEVSYSLNTDIS